MQQQKKLPGNPNVVLYYTPELAIAIPIFFIKNELEEQLFSEVFSRYKSLGRRLIYRRLITEKPFDCFDEWGQGIYGPGTLQAIANIAWHESLRFKALTRLEIGSLERFFYNGIELKRLPEKYNRYPVSSQTDENLGAFCRHYGIDFKEFLYPSSRLYGKYTCNADGNVE